jgi:hypothetical protein
VPGRLTCLSRTDADEGYNGIGLVHRNEEVQIFQSLQALRSKIQRQHNTRINENNNKNHETRRPSLTVPPFPLHISLHSHFTKPKQEAKVKLRASTSSGDGDGEACREASPVRRQVSPSPSAPCFGLVYVVDEGVYGEGAVGANRIGGRGW